MRLFDRRNRITRHRQISSRGIKSSLLGGATCSEQKWTKDGHLRHESDLPDSVRKARQRFRLPPQNNRWFDRIETSSQRWDKCFGFYVLQTRLLCHCHEKHNLIVATSCVIGSNGSLLHLQLGQREKSVGEKEDRLMQVRLGMVTQAKSVIGQFPAMRRWCVQQR